MYIENENWKYFKENTNYETRGICHIFTSHKCENM